MGSRLPVIGGRDAVQVFARFGWQVARQSSSHIILVKDGDMVTLSVPDHRELPKATLRGLTVEAFVSKT
jgi:predicted RNA binding protein YcfA (HicA-like mRNA interferase family)